jgi:hypothetical protein
MKSSTLILAIGLVILLNAGFSMLQCKDNRMIKQVIDRRYVQLELEEDQFSMPSDVIVETLIGFSLAIFATVLSYFSGMKDISFSA